MGAPLTIELFGPMRVLVDGEPMPRVRSRKALWLLALLVLRQGRPATREWVANALWPDSDAGLANLRPLISELRNAFGSQGERLLASDRTVAVDLDGADVDVLRFDAAIQAGDFATAIDLYRGELLEGCTEEWAAQEQRIRETSCLSALQSLGDSALEQCKYEEAAALFTRAIGIDTLRDPPRRGLMAAMAASGDTNGALQSYREFARVLSTEVSTAPDKETTRLYEKLRADLRRPERARAEPTPSNLAPPLTALVGREDETADVEERLRNGRLVTLTGVGGIGKTRLAVSVGLSAQAEFPQGVWFVALDNWTDGGAVAGAVASVLGVRDAQGRPLLEGIIDKLRQGRVLLILDNCEHLIDAAADLVAQVLRACHDVRVLATSREPLNIPGESVWHVPPLPFPSEANLPERKATRRRVAESYDCVQLFVERAKAARPEFELTDENVLAVVEVCAQVEGLPLGIELAAARTRSMSVVTLGERLKDHHLETLLVRSRGHNPRQAALRSTIDWSYMLLDEDDRQMLARLSVFAGGWTLDAAENVCGMSRTMDRLDSLVEKSMVVFDDLSERYRFLESVRQYALERLEESGEAATINAAYRAWCLAFAERASPGFRASDQAEWLHLADQEWPNLRKVLDQGDSDPDLALKLTAAVWYYWYIRSMRENYRFLEEAIRREGANDPLARAEVQLAQGVTRYSDRDHDGAQRCLDEALSGFNAIGDKRGQGRVLTIMGNLASVVEGYEPAVEYYERSLVFLREVNDLPVIALTLGNLAMLASQRDDYRAGQIYYEEGMRVAREIGADRSLAYQLVGLANMAERQGQGHLYRAHHEEALELFRKLGDKRGIAICLRHRGTGKWRVGDSASAILDIEESLELFREIGDPRDEGYALCFLARALMEVGDLSGAEKKITVAMDILTPLRDSHGIADCHYVLSMIYRKDGESAKSWRSLVECIKLWSDASRLYGLTDAFELAALHFATLCEDEAAGFFFGASEQLRQRLGSGRVEIDEPDYQLYRNQARTRLGAAKFDAAVETGGQATWQDAVAKAFEFDDPVNL